MKSLVSHNKTYQPAKERNRVVRFIGIFHLLIILIHTGVAQEVYFFSEGTDETYYDQGIVDVNNLGESTFAYTHPPGGPQWNDKVPCSTFAFKGTTSLKFSYTSSENGNWKVSIYRNDWSTADLTPTDSLSFYLYSEDEFPATALPLVAIKTVGPGGSGEITSSFYRLSDWNSKFNPGVWNRIVFPLDILFNENDLTREAVKGILFNQSENNNTSRELYLDEMVAFRSEDEIPPVEHLTVTGYDSHAELNWDPPSPNRIYRIYASFDQGSTFEIRGETAENDYLDFVPSRERNGTVIYRVVTLHQGRESESMEQQTEIREFSDEELLDMVQRYTFRYFWEGAHQASGMALERSNGNGQTAASGATGMGLMAMVAAHEREYESREAIKDRVGKILDFLANCERHHGAWSHWYQADTYQTQPFSEIDDGGDLVETSYVAQGLIAVKNYFTGNDAKSVLIRQKADTLWKEIDWDWYRKYGEYVLYWHWSPNYAFQKNMKVTGWNECLVTYIMAAASPTYGIPKEVYQQGWARNGSMVNKRTYYNHEINLSPNWGGPLFFIHYSHLGINPQGLKDQYADYWLEHVNTAEIHYEYARANPLNHTNYSEQCWGLTASDDPYGYTAHRPMNNDNGTISPTAALSSFPYTPEESMKALKYFYRERGADLFGRYGFFDAFNDNLQWVKESYIGIDQGPIVVMIENYRTGLLWDVVMKDADVQTGLDKLGFRYETQTRFLEIENNETVKVYPNPAFQTVFIDLDPSFRNKKITVQIFGIGGERVYYEETIPSTLSLEINDLFVTGGVCFIHLSNGEKEIHSKVLIQNR